MPAPLTPIAAITELESSQSQPEVPVNEALRKLEALAQISVISKTTSVPPTSPADGDCYLVGIGSTGAWTGKDNDLAVFNSSIWLFIPARAGQIAFVQNTDSYVRYSSAASPPEWVAFP